MTPEPVWTPVGPVDGFVDGKGRQVRIGARRIGVFRQGDTWRALKDSCPHAGVALHGGVVRDGTVTCPAHGWVIDLATGAVKQGVSGGRVAAYPVRVVDGVVEIGV